MMFNKLIQYLLFFLFSAATYLRAGENFFQIRQTDSLGNVQNMTFRLSLLNAPENVLILYNINYRVDENNNNIWDGYEIAEYYRQKRNIPGENIFAIQAPVSAEISREQYDSFYDESGENIGIRQQVENILLSNSDAQGNILRSKIKYIVLTKGIPHRVKYMESDAYFLADYASVDASLALIFNGNYNIRWYTANPYYNQDTDYSGDAPFIPEFYTNFDNLRLSFLVTRLDGYTLDDVKLMIDRGYRADNRAKSGLIVLDGANKTYDHMQEAAEILNTMGAQVYPNPWTDTEDHILSLEDSVLAIVGHGTHAGLPAEYLTDLFNFRLHDGALFSSYESFNGASFSPNQQFGQGQISDFIQTGGSGGIGNVYEPYNTNIPYESIFLPAYYAGYTFAEAAYMSLRRMDWTAVVVGDPLMRIDQIIPGPFENNLRIISAFPNSMAFNQSTNTVAKIVFNTRLDTMRLPAFITQPSGDTLRYFVHGQNLYLWPATPLPYDSVITYNSGDPVYSIEGDSLFLTEYARFLTHGSDQTPVGPQVYDAFPSGINISTDSELLFIFSMAMNPATIYPVKSNTEFEQVHTWQDNCILRIAHDPFLQGTFYSFLIDEHAKSAEDIGLSSNFQLSFQTRFNSIEYDIDNDGVTEFARNLNNTLLDGYEIYSDEGGIITAVHDTTDMNADNQMEFFIRLPQNDYPSFFWNPATIPFTGYIAVCVAMDDDEDGQTEYAFDANGSGFFTHVYDPGETDRVREINFVLLSSSPANNQQNVSLSGRLSLLFSIPPLLDNFTGYITTEPATGIESIYTDKNGREINIHYSQNFPPSTNINILINNGVSSVDNKFLAHDYSISFQTASQEIPDAPRVISFYPGDSLLAIDNTPTVRFVFSAPMRRNLSNPVLIDTTSAVHWSHLWADDRTLYLFPSQELSANSLFEFTLSSQLQDTSGQLIGGKTYFNFISGNVETDNNKPYILQIIPEPGRVISTGRSVVVIFSEWISESVDSWVNIQPQQAFTWSAYGANMFAFSGDPFWIPQSPLAIQLDGFQINDANFNYLQNDYTLNYYVLGNIVQRDLDNDGIYEFVVDNNNNVQDGFELYVDPGGIQTDALFVSDLDLDGFYDFLIADSVRSILLTWFPARGDSGLTGFSEQTDTDKFDVSLDSDDLVELSINSTLATVEPAIPRVRSVQPADGSDFVSLFTPLIFQFNTSMDAFSVVQSVSFSPSKGGKWSQSYLNSRFRFDPDNGWLPATIQAISLAPVYTAENGRSAQDEFSFSFRTTGEGETDSGILSWQFPAENDTVHPLANYFFAFSIPADTTQIPHFNVRQNFISKQTSGSWGADTLIKLSSPQGAVNGTALLESSGHIFFLNAPQLEFNRNTNYYISSGLSLKLVKSLFDALQLIPVSQQFSFIFNQPLQPVSMANISLNKIVNTDTSTVLFDILISNNLLTIIPENLDYSSTYRLILKKELQGVSGSTLAMDLVFNFETENPFILNTNDLSWEQAEDFIILNWPLMDNRQTIYEMYLSEDIDVKPDTVNNTNRYKISTNPSWLLDLKRFPAKAYIYVRLLSGNTTFWSAPLVIFNNSYNMGHLLSLPLTAVLNIDSLLFSQKYFQSVSQWQTAVPGWNSALYLPELQQWNASKIFTAHQGIMARSDRNGQIGWLQKLPQSNIIYDVINNQALQYQSLINYNPNIQASGLAAQFGNTIRVAVWDNLQQGWNEAVFDSSANVWVNDFGLEFMQPVYLYSTNELNNNAPFQKNISSEMESFPSRTQIFRFMETAHKAELFADGIAYGPLVGCGVDTLAGAAFINTANLDKRYNWQARFYNKTGQLITIYDFEPDKQQFNALPISFRLAHPYPNPFNNSVTIPIHMPEAGNVNLTVYNVLGQKIFTRRLFFNSGQIYNYTWQNPGASGIYFVTAQFKNHTDMVKVLMVK
jgi:uncharacterized protein (TIGR03790 family)